jgi:hypothetical protein
MLEQIPSKEMLMYKLSRPGQLKHRQTFLRGKEVKTYVPTFWIIFYKWH